MPAISHSVSHVLYMLAETDDTAFLVSLTHSVSTSYTLIILYEQANLDTLPHWLVLANVAGHQQLTLCRVTHISGIKGLSCSLKLVATSTQSALVILSLSCLCILPLAAVSKTLIHQGSVEDEPCIIHIPL